MLYLLENGADIDMFNNHHNTPFFLATESLQKEICQVKDKDQCFIHLTVKQTNRLTDRQAGRLTDRLMSD